MINRHIFLFLFLLFGAVTLQAQTPAGEKKQAKDVPSSAEEVNPLKEGNKIPPVSLTTPEGTPFNLNSFVKEQPVVLIFYRGGWCPYCNMHLKELMEADPELRAMGYLILAVSPDKPKKLAEFLTKHEITYSLLSDSAMHAAKAFGVAFQVEDKTVKRYQTFGIDLEKASGKKHHLLPVPSVFIIDHEGAIRYRYYNPDYKTRMKTDELLQQAKMAL